MAAPGVATDERPPGLMLVDGSDRAIVPDSGTAFPTQEAKGLSLSDEGPLRPVLRTIMDATRWYASTLDG